MVAYTAGRLAVSGEEGVSGEAGSAILFGECTVAHRVFRREEPRRYCNSCSLRVSNLELLH